MTACCRALPLLVVHISQPLEAKGTTSTIPQIAPSDFAREAVTTAFSVSSARELAEWITTELERVVPYDSAVFVDAREIRDLEPDGNQHHYALRLVARDEEIATVHLFRAAGARPFDDAERAALAEIAPALTLAYAAQQQWDKPSGTHRTLPPPTSRPLRPRAKQTLECLLEGMSEKEAAHALSLSPHTVHQYVKQLYRAYGVRSRPELLARLLRA